MTFCSMRWQHCPTGLDWHLTHIGGGDLSDTLAETG